MELLIKNIQQKDKRDFEEFLDNFCDNFGGILKEKMGNSPQAKMLKWSAKRVGINIDPFMESSATWSLLKKIYRLTIMSIAEKVPDAKQMIKRGIEKELQRIDKNVRVEMNG